MIELPDIAMRVPHLDQYFGVWACEEHRFRSMADHVGRMDLALHVQQRTGESRADTRRPYELTDGVATIELTGPLMKYYSSVSGGTSTVRARRQLRAARQDPDVASGILRIDSPGGTMAGAQDLADDVAAFAAAKPLFAYIEDLGASAAYLAASQATRIHANRGADVGAMGTFMVAVDSRRAAAMAGVDVYVIRAGEFKGAGIDGTEITPEQIAHWQTLVDAHNDQFIRAVAKGRKMRLGRVTELADGRLHIAADAEELKLIDGIRSFDETFSELAAKAKTQSKTRATRSMKTMDQESTVPAASADTEELIAVTSVNVVANYDELTAACAGADPAFLCEQLKGHATVDQATAAWMAEQNRRLQAQRAENEQLRAARKAPGVEVAIDGPDGAASTATSADPQTAWREAIDAKVKAGLSRQRAVSAVAREQPELREALVAAANLKTA